MNEMMWEDEPLESLTDDDQLVALRKHRILEMHGCYAG